MNIKPVTLIIRSVISAGLALALAGCPAANLPSKVRDIPAELGGALSLGDSREKVHSVLGEPLVYSVNLGVEVYRRSGHDVDVFISPPIIPLPLPGKKVSVATLVVYDRNGAVKAMNTGTWTEGADFWIRADGFHFANVHKYEPDTLLGPSVSWQDLANTKPTMGGCALVLIMGKCAMGHVSLDDHEIADLSPAGEYCSAGYWNNNFYGTFIRKDISSGTHQLRVHQKARRSKFEVSFDCKSGETIYAELDADVVHDVWRGFFLEGTILINKGPYKTLIDMGDLYPILWHRGTWYGSAASIPEGDAP